MSRPADKHPTGPRPLLIMEPISVGREHAAALLGIGVSTFEAHVSRGTLPRGRMLGGRAVWLVTELRQAAQALPVSDLLPPPAARRVGA